MKREEQKGKTKIPPKMTSQHNKVEHKDKKGVNIKRVAKHNLTKKSRKIKKKEQKSTKSSKGLGLLALREKDK